MSKKIVLGILLHLNLFLGYAQSTMLKGLVTDSITGEGLPFASLIYKGTTTGTSTDMEGKFSLSLPSERRMLEISYLGYESKRIPINNNH